MRAKLHFYCKTFGCYANIYDLCTQKRARLLTLGNHQVNL